MICITYCQKNDAEVLLIIKKLISWMNWSFNSNVLSIESSHDSETVTFWRNLQQFQTIFVHQVRKELLIEMPIIMHDRRRCHEWWHIQWNDFQYEILRLWNLCWMLSNCNIPRHFHAYGDFHTHCIPIIRYRHNAIHLYINLVFSNDNYMLLTVATINKVRRRWVAGTSTFFLFNTSRKSI